MHDHDGEARTDRDDGLGLLRCLLPADGPDQRRGDEVDSFDSQACLLDGVDDTVDQIDVGRGHQDPPHLSPSGEV